MNDRKTKSLEHVGFRLAPELLARLDRYVERQRKKTGFPVTRSSAVARFVERGLTSEEKK